MKMNHSCLGWCVVLFLLKGSEICHAAYSSSPCIFQVTNKQRREQQRLEKKKRQEERHRHKALESRSRDSNRSEADVNTQVTLVKTFAALNI